MARLSIGQKAHRVLKFLMGLRHPQVASALQRFGFGDAQLREGWILLSAVTSARLNERVFMADPKATTELDDFENVWFPVAKAVLQHTHPAMAEMLFLNLSQTAGKEVAVSVGTFLSRLRQMERGQGAFGPEGRRARRLLADHGLDEETVVEAESIVERLMQAREPAEQAPSPEDREAAEEEMWHWYLRWSAIARVAVKDRRLLRGMGFLKNRRATRDGEEEVLADSDQTESATTEPVSAESADDEMLGLAPTEPDLRVQSPTPRPATSAPQVQPTNGATPSFPQSGRSNERDPIAAE